jgi:prophage tail gpP-like protein
MAFPKLEETAVLIVNGRRYSDWESVQVRHALREHPWYTARFTCSEGMPLSKNFSALRIIPGMDCQVILAGFPAIQGLVNTRQVFYDSKRHHIELQVSSNTMGLASASVVSKTGEHKNVTYQQFATDLLKSTKSKFLVEGGKLPNLTFDRIAIPPGTSILEALEMQLRPLGAINLTSNAKGDVVAAVGANGGSDTVYEGDLGRPSILEGREIIYNPGMAQGIYGIGQKTGNNDVWGANAASANFAGLQFLSLAGLYAPQVVPLEIPAWTKEHLQGRTNAGRDWQTEDQVTVFATVYGWLRPSGGLWDRNQKVRVISPMLVMDGSLELQVKSVTFTQDIQSGTRSILELCNPAALAGFIPQGPGDG